MGKVTSLFKLTIAQSFAVAPIAAIIALIAVAGPGAWSLQNGSDSQQRAMGEMNAALELTDLKSELQTINSDVLAVVTAQAAGNEIDVMAEFDAVGARVDGLSARITELQSSGADIAAGTDTFDSLVEQFIDAECKGPGFANNGLPKWDSWKLVERSLNEYLVSLYGTRSIHHLTKADIRNALRRIVAKGYPQAANTAFWYMRAFFNWCRKEDVIAVSPCDGLENPAPIKNRERVVSDAELAAIWTGCDSIGYPFGAIVKLLILTGQRRTEVAAMRWSELDVETATWLLPGARAKNNEPSVVPLSTLAVAVLKSIPRLNDTFVFPARGNDESHFSGYAKGKKALDGKIDIDGKTLENWTLHDLRRTLATNLGERQVPPHVIEHILNHSAGSMSGVSKIYNRYAYGKEKREALEAWSDHVGGLVKQAA